MARKMQTVSFTVEQDYEIIVDTDMNFEQLFDYYYEGCSNGEIDMVEKINKLIARPIGKPEILCGSIETGVVEKVDDK